MKQKHYTRTCIAGAAALLLTGGVYAADFPSGFSKCANQDAVCKVGNAPRQVSFGAKDQFVIKTLSGNVACSVAVFGSDPLPGKAKKCAIAKNVAAPPHSPPPPLPPPPPPAPPPPPPVPPPPPIPAPPPPSPPLPPPPPPAPPPPPPVPPPPPIPAPPPPSPPVPPPPAGADASTDVAPTDGWAGQEGGTSGGSLAAPDAVFKVSSPTQLLAALKTAKGKAKIIKIYGTIDMASADNGGPFTSASDQAKRNEVKLDANTTLIGMGVDPTLINGRISIKKTSNVIVRNLKVVNPCDIAPQFDPNDGANGNFNSEYDGIVIDGSTHVWVDHNTFTDAPVTDDLLPIEKGLKKQCHDGSLDVKNGSDFVTVSNNRFELHDKNNLIGSSDSTTSDEGHLKVTFNDNHFLDISQRSPRVRFGQVHVYNNYYEGDKANKAYPHEFSIGVGFRAKIIAQNNAFDVIGANSCPDIVKNPGSASKTGAIIDTGSLVNGAPLNLATGCKFSPDVGWTVPYKITLLPTTDVKQTVPANAGAGKLTVK